MNSKKIYMNYPKKKYIYILNYDLMTTIRHLPPLCYDIYIYIYRAPKSMNE